MMTTTTTATAMAWIGTTTITARGGGGRRRISSGCCSCYGRCTSPLLLLKSAITKPRTFVAAVGLKENDHDGDKDMLLLSSELGRQQQQQQQQLIQPTKLSRPARKALERARKQQQQQQQQQQQRTRQPGQIQPPPRQEQQPSPPRMHASSSNRTDNNNNNNADRGRDAKLTMMKNSNDIAAHAILQHMRTLTLARSVTTPDDDDDGHADAAAMIRAIEQARKRLDVHGLQTIAESLFLIQHGTHHNDNTTTATATTTTTVLDSNRDGYRPMWLPRGSVLARLAIASMHLGCHDLASTALRERQQHYHHLNEQQQQQHRLSPSSSAAPHQPPPLESAAIIGALLRLQHNESEAWSVLEQELALPSSSIATITGTTTFATMPPDTMTATTTTRGILQHRARALASIASWHFFRAESEPAVLACQKLAQVGTIIQRQQQQPEPKAARPGGLPPVDGGEGPSVGLELNIPWERLLRGAAHCEVARRNMARAAAPPTDPLLQQQQRVQANDHDDNQVKLPCNVAYSVLDAMCSFQPENRDSVYECLSNALIRRVVFVTGAVSMAGCPPMDRGEVAFIGRSNVGKSSLINMITNRKSLAYTSKRPGKTRQFNYFAVNDKPGREKEIIYGDALPGTKDADSFYMVDLPGFGYAEVPDEQRKQWATFMHEYLTQRRNLRVVFHLIDGRLGPTVDDVAIMKQVRQDLLSSSSAAAQVSYVIVMTKTDKNVNGPVSKYAGRVSKDIMNKMHAAMAESRLGNHVPVILSSAETKLGRDQLWRYLRLAAESTL